MASRCVLLAESLAKLFELVPADSILTEYVIWLVLLVVCGSIAVYVCGLGSFEVWRY